MDLPENTMYRLTDIETNRARPGKVRRDLSQWRESLTIATPATGERFLVTAASGKAEAQCLDFVRRFAGRTTEICLFKSSSAAEARRLAHVFGAHWLCMVTERGSGLMSLFLTKHAEEMLRTSPCPVICIPKSYLPAGNGNGTSWDSHPVRRILVPIKPSAKSRWLIEAAVGIAERFGAKLDVMGVDELLRNPAGLSAASRRRAYREQARAIRSQLSELTAVLIPRRLHGRRLVSVGVPFFHAVNQHSRQLSSDLIILSVPNGLWSADERIDVATERILHRAGCPVICMTPPASSSDADGSDSLAEGSPIRISELNLPGADRGRARCCRTNVQERAANRRALNLNTN